MLESDEQYGFAIIDGNGAHFFAVQGNAQKLLHHFVVSLPKKHRRGGQSAKRFARLREISRHHFVTKVCEILTKFYIDTEKNMPNVRGLVFAGNAEFKNVVYESKLLDPRLKSVVISVVDVVYGGASGLNQAIELTEEALKNVSIVRQKKVISKFFEEIALESGRVSYGVKDTLAALDLGAIHTLIMWENVMLVRYVIADKETGNKSVVVVEPDHQFDQSVEILESSLFIDYIAENYESLGFKLELVQDCTPEGNQFCKGFGGLGALLRYRVEFPEEEILDDEFSDLYEDFI